MANINPKCSPWVAVLLVVASTAYAELGGDVGTMEMDRASMNAVRHTLPAQKYAVRLIQTPSGTSIREYVSPEGRVFAVTWFGPQMPDLRQLFGTYFGRYQKAANAKRDGHGPLHIAESELVVHSGGHMRAYSGQAYIPQLVPNNVSIDEIR